MRRLLFVALAGWVARFAVLELASRLGRRLPVRPAPPDPPAPPGSMRDPD